MIKGSIYQENITVLNVHATNKRVSTTWSKPDRTEKRNRQIHNYS